MPELKDEVQKIIRDMFEIASMPLLSFISESIFAAGEVMDKIREEQSKKVSK